MKIYGHPLLLVSFFVAFTFSSCHEVYFDQPQPRNGKRLDVFPEKLQGKWNFEGGYIAIDSNMVTFFENGDSCPEVTPLSPDLILMQSERYYVLNYHVELWWSLNILHLQKSGDIFAYRLNEVPKFSPKSGIEAMVVVDDSANCDTSGFCPALLEHVVNRKDLSTRESSLYFTGTIPERELRKLTTSRNLVLILRKNGVCEFPGKN